jgi:hypothetical protein
MAAPNGNLTCITAPDGEADETDFWLSDPEPMDDGLGDWGFALYAAKDVWLCTFTYPDEALAKEARVAIVPALTNCIFVATSES